MCLFFFHFFVFLFPFLFEFLELCGVAQNLWLRFQRNENCEKKFTFISNFNIQYNSLPFSYKEFIVFFIKVYVSCKYLRILKKNGIFSKIMKITFFFFSSFSGKKNFCIERKRKRYNSKNYSNCNVSNYLVVKCWLLSTVKCLEYN